MGLTYSVKPIFFYNFIILFNLFHENTLLDGILELIMLFFHRMCCFGGYFGFYQRKLSKG